MLSVKNLVKTYRQGRSKNNVVTALNNVSIDFPDKGLVFLLGKSGSGKSTLLNAIGGLDAFDSGEIIIKGKSSATFSQSDFDSYRNTFIGFIFQEYNILENFSVAKNIALAMELQGKKATKDKVNAILEQVDLLQFAKRKPNQLSGGQKQRVAIARALIKNPEIIMADEPTGALDSATGKQVMETLKNLSKSKLVIIVSHDRDFAETYGDRIIELKDGKIISDTTKKEVEAKKTKSGLSFVEDQYIHIKKGQTLTDKDFDIIVASLLKNTDKADTIISLNADANKEIKKSEGISEEGNQQVFKKTELDDIKKDKANSNIKLIKSKLKFSDSFKLGASALKNKVGKLVFTILLSFFAFACFGVIDALSCWNKVDSLYNTMTTTQEKNLSLEKKLKKENYSQTNIITSADIEDLEEMFDDYSFLAGIKNKYNSGSFSINGKSVVTASKGIYQTYINGYTTITQDQINSLGFELSGNLPQNENEICISKHLMNVITKADDSLTSYESMKIVINGNDEKTIVGVIDSKTDLSKYENVTDEQLNSDYQLAYQIQNYLNIGYTNIVYVHKNYLTSLYKSNATSNLSASIENSRAGWGFEVDSLQTLDTNATLFQDLTYFKEGKTFASNDEIVLEKDEIIIPYYYFEEYSTNSIEEEIDNGLYFVVKGNFDNVIKKFKIAGYTTINYGLYTSQETLSAFSDCFVGNYDFLLTQLKLQESDKQLFSFCDTISQDNEFYTINCSASSTISMFEGIISTAQSIFLYIAIAFAVFASLLLMNYISTSISYKKREIGVLRALGARSIDVFGIFFNESIIIATINFVLSAIATLAICAFINSYLILELGLAISLFNASVRQIILLVGLSIASAFLASFIPVMKIAKKKPIDAINNR